MLYFATLFDFNYLSRGLCLIESLTNTLHERFTLFILALDQETIAYFSAHPNSQVVILSLEQVEAHFQELNEAKRNRSKIEYYFTLSPVLPLYILENYKDCNRITSLDADIFFFDSPEFFFKEINENDILITPHDFSPRLNDLAKYGIYNVSFQSFPNTKNGFDVLHDWKQKCLAWCKDYSDPETGYFADQKYLDDWSQEFTHIVPIRLKTFGRAPWNISSTNLIYTGDKFYVDDKPLVYYHFHNLRLKGNLVTHDLQNYDMPDLTRAVKSLYRIYVRLLNINNKKTGSFSDKNVIRYNRMADHQGSLLKRIWEHPYGAVIGSFNKIIFFNICKLKSGYQSLIKKIGSFN